MPPSKKKTSKSNPPIATDSIVAPSTEADGTTHTLEIKPDTATKKQAPKKAEPSYGSKCRRKRELVNQIKEGVDYAKQLEIRAILDGELKDIPVLSADELGRLDD